MAKLNSGTRIYGNLTIDTWANITGTTTSTSTTTGALVVAGGAGIAGRVSAGNIVTTSGVYWANGAAYSSGSSGGMTYTTSTSAPVSPSAGNFWYDSSADKLYQYINDGTSSSWVDQSYPTSFGNLTVANTLTVSGSIVGTATNANYASASNVSLYDSYTATTTNATFYPQLVDKTTGNGAGFTASTLTFNPSTGALGATTLSGTLSTAAQTNITSIGSLTSLTINTANTAVDGAHIYSVNAASVSQLSLHATSGVNNRQSKIKFFGTFFNTPGDTGERYVTSIRSGFDSTNNAWGSEFLGVYVNSTANDANSDANQNLIATFSNYGGIKAYTNVVPSANVTYNLGSTTAWWNNMYGKAIQAQYADLAEHYAADADHAPGTVVVFGGAKEITVSNISHDPRVAGVISTNPAYLMNAANAGLPVALTGRVPCQVQGPVAKGDRLVNIDTGVAGRLDPALHEYGCIIGKSLGEIADDSIQTIEIVVGRF